MITRILNWLREFLQYLFGYNRINHVILEADHHINNKDDDTTSTTESCENVSSEIPENLQPQKRSLPNLPKDLSALKIKCESMSPEVLELLSQKIKEELAQAKEDKNHSRCGELRELSWKVTDLMALGVEKVNRMSNKSNWKVKQEKHAKKYKHKNKQWNQQPARNDYQTSEPSKNKGCNRRNNRQRRGFGNRSGYDRSQNWKDEKRFNIEDAKQLAKNLVDDIIAKAIKEFSSKIGPKQIAQCPQEVEHQQEAEPAQDESLVTLAINLVNDIISSSIDEIISGSSSICMTKHQNDCDLSVAEAELLFDMREDEFSERDSFMKDIDDELIIKNEPNCAGG